MIIVGLKMASQMGKGWEPLCSNCRNFSLQSSWVGYVSLISQFQWWYGRYLNLKSRLTMWQERTVYTEERVQSQRRKRSREHIWSIHVHTYKSGSNAQKRVNPILQRGLESYSIATCPLNICVFDFWFLQVCWILKALPFFFITLFDMRQCCEASNHDKRRRRRLLTLTLNRNHLLRSDF